MIYNSQWHEERVFSSSEGTQNLGQISSHFVHLPGISDELAAKTISNFNTGNMKHTYIQSASNIQFLTLTIHPTLVNRHFMDEWRAYLGTDGNLQVSNWCPLTLFSLSAVSLASLCMWRDSRGWKRHVGSPSDEQSDSGFQFPIVESCWNKLPPALVFLIRKHSVSPGKKFCQMSSHKVPKVKIGPKFEDQCSKERLQ